MLRATAGVDYVNIGMFAVQAIGGESPRANVEPMADVLMALNRNHSTVLQSCLEAVTLRDGFPTERIVQDDKRQFARKILAYVSYCSTYNQTGRPT